MKLRLWLLVAVFGLMSGTFGQTRTWIRTSLGSEDRYVGAVAIADDMVLASHRANAQGNTSIFLDRVRPDGTVAWTAEYRNNLASGFYVSAIEESGGAIYVSGYDNATPRNLYVLSFTAAGQSNWSRRIPASALEGPTSGDVRMSIGANVVLATKMSDNTGRVAIVQQPANGGNPLVTHLVPFLGSDLRLDGLLARANSITVAVLEAAFGTEDLVIAQLAPSGDVNWTQTLWRPADAGKHAVALTAGPDSSVLVTARLQQGPNRTVLVSRIASNGLIAWQRFWAPEPETVPGGAVLLDNRLWVPGWSRATSIGPFQYVVDSFAVSNGATVRGYRLEGLLRVDKVARGSTVFAVGAVERTSTFRPHVALFSGMSRQWAYQTPDGGTVENEDYAIAVDASDAVIALGRRGTGPSGEAFAFRVFAPVPVKSVSVQPTSVPGGTGFTGTVVLERPAPPSGTVVTLTRSNPAATVPATVTVAGGASQANFSGSTSSVGVTVGVTITATSGSSSKQTSIQVRTAELQLVSVDGSPLPGGETAVGRVRLTSTVRADTTVTLADNSSKVTVPSSVIVRANTREATFPVTTAGVSANTVVRVVASMGRASVLFDLTLTPPKLESITVPALESTRSGSAVVRWRGVPLSSTTLSLSYGNLAGPASVPVAAGTKSRTITVTAPARPALFTMTMNAGGFGGNVSGTGQGHPVPITSISTFGSLRASVPFELRLGLLANLSPGTPVRVSLTKVSGPGSAFIGGLPLSANPTIVTLQIQSPFFSRVRGQMQISAAGTTVIRASVVGQLSAPVQQSITIP